MFLRTLKLGEIKMNNFSRIHSSWNSDRMGSCVASKVRKERAVRKPYLYAQYRDNEVSVRGARGKARFTLKFDRKVVSAIVRDDRLIVTTEDECIRHYDVMTSKLVSEIRPTPPEGGSVIAAYSLAA